MALTVTVSGTNRTGLWSSVHETEWEIAVNGQASGAITFRDLSSGFAPSEGQKVIILDGGSPAFTGFIVGEPKTVRIGGNNADPTIGYTCELADFGWILGDRIASKEYEADTYTLKEIVEDLISTYASGDGITTTGVETGPTIAELVVFNYVSLVQALNDLQAITGYVWWFDNADLQFRDPASLSAPADLDGSTLITDTVTVQRIKRQPYRNRQIVRGGTDMHPIIAQASDASEITARAAIEGTSGIHVRADVVQDAVTEAQVTAAAQAKLDAAKSTSAYMISGQTRTSGFEPGQQATADFPDLGISSETVNIGRVRYVVDVDRTIRSHVEAQTNVPDGGWEQFYREPLRHRAPIPFQLAPIEGATRVDMKAGAVIMDPPTEPGAWLQAEVSGTLDSTPSSIGIIHRRTPGVGSGTYWASARRDASPTPDETVVETWLIDADFKPATSPTKTFRWEELSGISTYKDRLIVSPDNVYAVGVQYDSPGVLFVVSIAGEGLKGSVASNLSAQGNTGHGVWVGDYVYIPNISDGKVYIYDVSDPANPSEVGAFTTSMSALFSVRASSNGQVLYFTGTGGTAAASIAADPESPGPTANSGALSLDVVASAGTITRAAGDFTADGFEAGQSILLSGFANAGNNDYFIIETVTATVITVTDNTGMVDETGSGDEEVDAVEDSKIDTTSDYVDAALSDDGTLLAGAKRASSTQCRVLTVAVSGASLTLTAETLVDLSTTQMDGEGAMLLDGSLIVFNDRNGSGTANSTKAHVFDVTDPSAPTFTETLSYTHAANGNVGPAVTPDGRMALFTFGFNSDAQITHGEERFDRVVPPEVEAELRAAFGGTGLGDYLPGDVIVATARDTLGVVGPATSPGSVIVADFDEPGLRRNGRVLEDCLNVAEIDDGDSPYTIGGGEDGAAADATSGAVTVEPPALADSLNRLLFIGNVGDGTNAVTFDPASTEQVDGSSTKVLSGAGEWALILGRASQWETVASGGSPDRVRGHIDGCGTANNATDSDHDIDFSAGTFADTLGGSGKVLVLSAMTKRIDATWAEGTNQGGMATGSVAADTEYNLILIEKDSNGTIDAMFDVSATGANAPSGWTARRRILSVFTNGSANIRLYWQTGDRVTYQSPITDVADSTLTLGTWETGTLTVPADSIALLGMDGNATSATKISVSLRTKGATGNTIGREFGMTFDNASSATRGVAMSGASLLVDANSQIEYAPDGVGTPNIIRVYTLGWIDDRGRHA